MFQLSTKAKTLQQLEGKLKSAKVLPQVTFTVEEYRKNRDCIWQQVESLFPMRKLVIRSSALNEDTELESKAGMYESVLNVSGKAEFETAALTVIDSFGKAQDKDEVLVQPMLEDVVMCGVAFTLDPNTLGNYYVINYDDKTGSTSSITSGTGGTDRLFYCFKNVESVENVKLQKLIYALRELESLFGKNNLDVEFAFDKREILYIFQVRPLCVKEQALTCEKQGEVLGNIAKKIKRENKRRPFLYGKRTIYGVMPDWNPAEIIGIRPRQLALSLYKEIITDNIWAYQRDNYGYQNLRSFPLLIDFYGLPYIDVRVSFNSFVPKGLSPELSEKLVNYYLDRLESHPNLHDKIEFEIAFTCYTLDLPERIQVLAEQGFSREEIRELEIALREMTKVIIDNEEGLWKKDYEKIDYLVERYESVIQSDLDKVSKIYWLLEDLKRYGTLPFAGLARAGFIAVQLLKSMVQKNILTQEEYQIFMGELSTVSTNMCKDRKELSKGAFLHKYGHLRPGTYDINSPRYDEEPDTYFDWNVVPEENNSRNIFKLSLTQIEALKEMLQENGLPDDVLGVFHFIKTAIEGREYAKFVFTKSLSEVIKLFGEMGEEYGFSKEECSYADISIMKEMYASSLDGMDLLAKSIAKGKDKYQITKTLVLPPLLLSEKEALAFHYPETQPNYITLKEVSGEIVVLDNCTQEEYKLDGKIIMITSADPGYDWIFSRSVKGFITKFGGANSHMAIRANELGIPAIIGAGEQLFEKLSKANSVQIDAAGKKVTILK